MDIKLGEFFDWAAKRSQGETLPVLVAAHIELDWYLMDAANQPRLIPINEWLQGWELDDLLDRIILHNLGQPKQGYDSWVVKQYKGEEFLGKIKYLGIWTIDRVYLGVTGYDGIEGLQSWDRSELRNSGFTVRGYTAEESDSESITADPVQYEFDDNRILTPTSNILEKSDELLTSTRKQNF